MPAWTPSVVVADVSPIITNLLAYFRTNQTEALKWANGGASGLSDFQIIYNTDEGTFHTIFDNIQVFGERYQTSFLDHGVQVDYAITLLCEIQGSDATALKTTAKKKIRAVESMCLNIPSSTLMSGVTNYTKPTINELTHEEGSLRGEAGNWLIPVFVRFSFEFTLL